MKNLLTTEQKQIIKPEFDKMQEFLNAKPKVLNSVIVMFEDSSFNYNTSISYKATEESVRNYFVNGSFNVAPYGQPENFKRCIDIKFTDNNI